VDPPKDDGREFSGGAQPTQGHGEAREICGRWFGHERAPETLTDRLDAGHGSGRSSRWFWGSVSRVAVEVTVMRAPEQVAAVAPLVAPRVPGPRVEWAGALVAPAASAPERIGRAFPRVAACAESSAVRGVTYLTIEGNSVLTDLTALRGSPS
jgi:hypothetical protein